MLPSPDYSSPADSLLKFLVCSLTGLHFKFTNSAYAAGGRAPRWAHQVPGPACQLAASKAPTSAGPARLVRALKLACCKPSSACPICSCGSAYTVREPTRTHRGPYAGKQPCFGKSAQDNAIKLEVLRHLPSVCMQRAQPPRSRRCARSGIAWSVRVSVLPTRRGAVLALM